jgi:hypothetical protein
MNTEEVISKVKGLLRFTVENGCTEGEAMNAARKIGHLLSTFDLSMGQVLFDSQKCERYHHYIDGKNRDALQWTCMALANFCHCKHWIWTEGYKSNKRVAYVFFGLPSDLEMVKHLLAVISRSLDVSLEVYKFSPEYKGNPAHGRAKNASFQNAMALRISARLKEMTIERNADYSTVVPATGTSLMVLKNNNLDKAYNALNLDLSKSYSSCTRRDVVSIMAGQRAGDKVNLSRPLGEDAGMKMLA